MEVQQVVERRHLPDTEERRRLRIEAQLNLDDIAELVGVTASAVSRWERGTRTPTGSRRVAYVAILRELDEVLR